MLGLRNSWSKRHSFVRYSRRPPIGNVSSMYNPGGSVWTTRRQRAVAYLKAKKAEYTSSLYDSDEEISSPYRNAARLNQPFKGEQLVLYPSYSRRLYSDDKYEVEVRGWLYLPGDDNRKSRILHSLARQLSKVSSQPVEKFSAQEQKLITFLHESEEHSDNTSEINSLKHRDSSASSISTDSVKSDINDVILKNRVAGFLARPAPGRKLTILVGAQQSMDNMVDSLETVDVVTNSSGRFSTRVRVPYKPSFVHVAASDDVSSVETVLDIDSHGVSVITDIDDTIRHTGVTGDKREMFRNVFVRDYNEVLIEGVSHWYKVMETMGVKFHYVSNSPWQIIKIISEYLDHAGMPKGSIHLKEYTGLLKGLLEPASERKKPTLQAILRDFPHRKFILVGDSGERDLEAYVDLAVEFPKQVAAIYIRDITLPIDDKTVLSNNRDLLDEPISARVVRGQPIQDDFYQSNYVRSSKSAPSIARSVPTSLRAMPSLGGAAAHSMSLPRTNSGIKRDSVKPIRDLIDLDDDEETKRFTVPRKPVPPPIPSKPEYLRTGRPIKPATNPPPLPLRPRETEPVIMPSSQNDAGIYDIFDKRVESWKNRVVRARQQLPPGVSLRMWRQGYDMEDECVRKVKDILGSV